MRPEATLYCGAVQTMPFARPHFDELIAALDFAIAKDYPACGEYTGALPAWEGWSLIERGHTAGGLRDR